MAHAATLSSLADGLLTAVTTQTPDDPGFSRLKIRTVKSLQDQSYARTNQYAVRERLVGLVEKFAILNREDLSDALQARLDQLPHNSQWLPEILALLLELSDRPLEKTRLEDLELLSAKADVEVELTWEEILAEDPNDDTDLWKDVGRGYHSSGDEVEADVGSDQTAWTEATSTYGDDLASMARLHLMQPGPATLTGVLQSRDFWRSSATTPDRHDVSELVLIREMFVMLRGLPTDLYSMSTQPTLGTASKEAVTSILEQNAEAEGACKFLRHWVVLQQTIAYLQSVQEVVRAMLSSFASSLAQMEQRYVGVPKDTNVSVMEVQTEVRQLVRPIVKISQLLQRLPESAKCGENFLLLDRLYDEAYIAEMMDDHALYQSLASVFLSGFRTYLRLVVNWVETGSVSSRDDAVFFVQSADQSCPPGEVWHNRFALRKEKAGHLHAPKCLSDFTDRVFAIGKSKMFVRLLEQAENGAGAIVSFKKLPMLQDLANPGSIESFPRTLSRTLESWIATAGIDQAPVLKTLLFHDHEVSRHLTALPYLYFSKDSSVFQQYAETLVTKIRAERNLGGFSDHVLLSELAQSTFGSLPAVDAQRISISMADERTGPVAGSTIRRLASFKLRYSLPWAMQNITRCTSPEAHADVFGLLLQLKSASSFLQSHLHSLRGEEQPPAAALRLRQELLYFIEIVLYHVTTTADVLHREMQRDLESGNDIDVMVAIWAAYEKRLQVNLLLTSNLEPVRESITRTLEFCEVVARGVAEEAAGAMHARFKDTVAFLVTGVRGVSRAGGEAALEALAERLGWVVP